MTSTAPAPPSKGDVPAGTPAHGGPPRGGTGPVGGTALPVNEARFPVGFAGGAGEYFRIWIVNVLLSVLTLGVYSAWAKVRDRRWFAGHTVLDGSAFDYHATGLQILVGRVVAVLLLVLVGVGELLHPALPVALGALLVLGLPWVLWRSTRFDLRMTSYRNVRFDFAGSLGGMYLWALVVPFLPLAIGAGLSGLALAAGLHPAWAGAAAGSGVVATIALSPWAHRQLAAYTLNGYRYGRARFSGGLSTKRFYAIYAKAFLLALALGTLVTIACATVVALVAGLSDGALPELGASGTDPQTAFLVAAGVGYPVVLISGLLLTAYFHVRVRAHLFGSAALDGRVGFESTMATGSLFRLKLSNLVIRVVTLGLGTPWARVRSARYEARHTLVHAAGGIGAVVDDERARRSALGEEIGEAFDAELDVGF